MAVAVAEKVDTTPHMRVISAGGSTITGGQLRDLDENTDVRSDRWYGTPWTLGIGSKMMRDAHVRQAFDAVVDPVVAADWDFDPEDESPLAAETADWCRHVYFERNDWKCAIRALMNYVRDGFAFVEQTDDVRDFNVARFPSHVNRATGQGIIVTGLHPIPAWSVSGFWQSRENTRQLDHIVQTVPGSDEEQGGYRPIDARHLIRATWEQEGANFAGLAPLRSAYGPWKVKRTLMIIEPIKHEREHLGIPSFTMPADTSEAEVAVAEETLAQIRANAKSFFVNFDGTKFEWNNSDGGTDINTTIERCNRDIAYNATSVFKLLGSQGTHGSFALANAGIGTYELSEEKHADFIEGRFNFGSDGWSPIRRTIAQNFGAGAPVPRLVARNMPTRDWSVTLPLVHNLTNSANFTPDDVSEAFLRRVMRMPQRDLQTSRARPPVSSALPLDVGPNSSPPAEEGA